MLMSVLSDLPLSYQWQFNDQNLPGQTNAVLTVDSVTSAQVGQYRMVASTVCNGATNQWYGPEASVTIVGSLSLVLQQIVTATNLANQFTISGPAGQQFILESSPDLETWQPVLTNTLPLGGGMVLQLAATNNSPAVFFRTMTPTTAVIEF